MQVDPGTARRGYPATCCLGGLGGLDIANVIFRDQTDAERAEREALDKKAEFDALIRASLDGYVLVGEGDRILDVNEAACGMYGYTREEMLRLGIRDIEAALDAPTVQARIGEILRQGWSRFVSRNRRKDGSVIDVEISIFVVRGERERLVCIVRDIGERLRAEERLRVSEERHRRVLEYSRAITFNAAPDGHLTYLSSSVESVLGFSPTDLMTRSLAQARLLAPGSLEVVNGYIADVLADCAAGRAPGSLHADLEYRTRDGATKVIEVSAFPIHRPDGTLSEFLGIGRDVTEERRTAEALRRSEARFRALAECSPLGIYETDASGANVYLNQAAAALLGQSPDQARGKGWERAIHPDDRERVFREWYEAVAARRVYTSEHRFVKPGGEVATMRIYADALRDAAGAVTGFVGVMIDVTKERQAEEQLAVASRLAGLGTLVAGVGHEINNPLAAAMANDSAAAADLAELERRLRSGAPPPADELLERVIELRDSVEHALAGDKRIARIVKDLVALGRPGAQRERVSLRSVVEAATRWLPLSAGREAVIEVREEAPCEVLAHSGQIAQVVINLVSNAARAARAGAPARITLRIGPGRPGKGRLQVVDDGVGMNAETLRRIFDPFFSTRPPGQGTGLGLSVCQAIVTEHGGTITATSEPGKGTTFTVELPAA